MPKAKDKEAVVEQLDEREGLPSASSMPYLFNCTPAFKIIQDNKLKVVETAAMRRGTKIHTALEKSDTEGLSESDARTYDILINIEAQAINDYNFEGAVAEKEQRYWLRDPFTDKKLVSARIDVAHVLDKRGIVFNYKPGFAADFTDSYWQVVCEAVCFATEKGIDEIHGACITVKGLAHPISLSGDKLVEATNMMRSKAEDMIAGKGEFCKGSWCTYCPVYKANLCPAYAKSLAIKDTTYAIESMTPEQRQSLYVKVKEVAKFCDKLIEDLRSYIGRGDVSGFFLKANEQRQFITSQDSLIAIADEIGWDNLCNIITVPLGKLEEEMQVKLKCTEKIAKEKVNEVFSGFIKKNKVERITATKE